MFTHSPRHIIERVIDSGICLGIHGLDNFNPLCSTCNNGSCDDGPKNPSSPTTHGNTTPTSRAESLSPTSTLAMVPIQSDDPTSTTSPISISIPTPTTSSTSATDQVPASDTETLTRSVATGQDLSMSISVSESYTEYPGTSILASPSPSPQLVHDSSTPRPSIPLGVIVGATVAPVVVLGLTMVGLLRWRKRRQLYGDEAARGA